MSDSEMNTDEETYSDSGTIHATLPESEGQPGSATELVLRATTVGRVVHFKRVSLFQCYTHCCSNITTESIRMAHTRSIH